jgi:hypothetical protein
MEMEPGMRSWGREGVGRVTRNWRGVCASCWVFWSGRDEGVRRRSVGVRSWKWNWRRHRY